MLHCIMHGAYISVASSMISVFIIVVYNSLLLLLFLLVRYYIVLFCAVLTF